MNHFIGRIPGNVQSKGGTATDILALLGITGLTELNAPNDGRAGSISSVVIGGKQYALSDILGKISGVIGDGLTVKISGSDTYETDHTFAEMVAASTLDVSWNGKPAIDVSYTKSGSTVTAIVVKFLTFGETMAVTTFTIASSSITKATAEYVLTEPSAEET